MTNKLTDTENAAVAETEKAFEKAGWQDGWQLTDAEVRSAEKPLFYRNATEASAEEARVTIGASKYMLYAIYNVTLSPNYAGDRIHNTDVETATFLYYTNNSLFYKNPKTDRTSPMAHFLSDLLEQFGRMGWTVDPSGGETAVQATTPNSKYLTRRVIIFRKNF